MKLLTKYAWLITGHTFNFAGISAGTAIAVAAAAASAIGTAASASSAGKSAKKGAYNASLLARGAAERAANLRINGGWGGGGIGGATEKLKAASQQNYLTQLAASQQMYANNLEAQAGKLAAQLKAQPNMTAIQKKSVEQQYAALMRGAKDARDAEKRGAGNILNAGLGAAEGIYKAKAGGENKSYKALSEASKKAAFEQLASLQLSDAEYKQAYADIEKRFSPYTDAGKAAIDKQQALMGMKGSEAYQGEVAKLENDQYRGLVAQGEDALLQNASATGGLRGGNTAAALAQFRPQMMQSLIDKQLSGYGDMAGKGLQATGQVSSYRDQLGGRLAGNAERGGDIRGQNSMNQGRYASERDRNIAGYGAERAGNRGIAQQDYYRSRAASDSNYATTTGGYGATRAGNLNAIDYNELKERLQFHLDNLGTVKDYENEKILTQAGLNVENINTQYGADANRLLAEAGIWADAEEKIGGITSENAREQGNINAQQKLAYGKAGSQLLGGLTSAATDYYSKRPQQYQPQPLQSFQQPYRQQWSNQPQQYQQGQQVFFGLRGNEATPGQSNRGFWGK